MQKNFDLLDKIHNLKVEDAISAGVIVSYKHLKLFQFLIEDLNYFLKYSEVNEKFPISRYYFRTIKQYITDKIIEK